MATPLKPQEIAALAAAALGGRDANASAVAIATAVSMAENPRGDPDAVNVNTDGSRDVGLWQINSIHQVDHPGWSEAWLKVPANNAQAMATVSKGGTDWSPWVQFRNQGYREKLSIAQAATAAAAGLGDVPFVDEIPDPLEAAEDVVDVLKTVAGFVSDAAGWLGRPHNWVRILYVAAGVAGIVTAAALIAKQQVREQVTQTVAPLTESRPS